jgi:hypothetical protein
LRLHGLILLQHQLVELAQQSSLSDRMQPPPQALRDRVSWPPSSASADGRCSRASRKPRGGNWST